MLDPWYGAQGCAAELLEEGLTRADYLEHGGDRIKHHKYGNYKIYRIQFMPGLFLGLGFIAALHASI